MLLLLLLLSALIQYKFINFDWNVKLLLFWLLVLLSPQKIGLISPVTILLSTDISRKTVKRPSSVGTLPVGR